MTISITISITITFDPTDIAAIINALKQTPAAQPPSDSSVPSISSTPPRTLRPHTTGERPAKRPAKTKETGPTAEESRPFVGLYIPTGNLPDGAQPSPTVVTTIPPATITEPATLPAEPMPTVSETNGTHRNTQPRPQLPWDAFDQLVRSEVRRLAMDGRVPGHKLWESERDQRLPTLGAVLQRYKTPTLVEFAALMGMEAPLRAQPLGGIPTNTP